MAPQRILVIEDETPILEVLTQALARKGYQVSTASDGDTGLDKALAEMPDLILLDLMLPRMDGWEVCRRLRAEAATRRTPIIMVTARREERDAVEGLSIGADDYVRKPFSLKELLARIEALLRRASLEEGDDSSRLELRNLRLDRESQMAYLDGQELDLSPTEFKILELLAQRPGVPLSRDRLLNRVWGLWGGDTRTLDTHISRLRKKLSAIAGAPTIEALRGRGYRLLWEEDGRP